MSTPEQFEEMSLWHFRLRSQAPERAASRILQILETQRVLAQRFETVRCHDDLHIQFQLKATVRQANRVGLLLQRAFAVASALWVPVLDACEEERLWSRTAFATWAATDGGVDLDPGSEWWCDAPAVRMDSDAFGVRVADHDTEVRLRWSDTSLYLLFVCAYRELSPRPSQAVLHRPTDLLWEHDVAELFLGVDAKPFQRYMEFEVSPRAEWIDLDIRSEAGEVLGRAPLHSGFKVAARVDEKARRWYASMRIPLPPSVLEEASDLRLNLFRSQGPQPVEVTWQPTRHSSFHVPSAFGYLRLLRP